MTALDEVETATVLEAVAGERICMPILLAVITGMRRGEIAALRWKDVDLEADTLAVRRALDRTKQGLVSAKSRRLIAAPQMLVRALGSIEQLAAERLRLGPAYEDKDLVCPRRDGRLWDPEEMSDAFRALQLSTQRRRRLFGYTCSPL